MEEIDRLHKRLKKWCNIDITFFGNYPWIYLNTVNNNKVKEKYYSDHGFTIGFLPIRKEQKFKFLNLTELFKILRIYR